MVGDWDDERFGVAARAVGEESLSLLLGTKIELLVESHDISAALILPSFTLTFRLG